MSMKRSVWLIAWGTLWGLGGFSLLRKGLYLFFVAQESSASMPMLKFLSHFIHNAGNASLLLIALALVLGIIKGRTVITKSAQRVIKTLNGKTISIKPMIPVLGIIVLMVSLGLLINILKIPGDVRGFIDVVIGTALLQGSFVFFKALNTPHPMKA